MVSSLSKKKIGSSLKIFKRRNWSVIGKRQVCLGIGEVEVTTTERKISHNSICPVIPLNSDRGPYRRYDYRCAGNRLVIDRQRPGLKRKDLFRLHFRSTSAFRVGTKTFKTNTDVVTPRPRALCGPRSDVEYRDGTTVVGVQRDSEPTNRGRRGRPLESRRKHS